MIINGIDYPIIGEVTSKKTGETYPLLDIPMMSDERWKELTNSPEQIARRKQRSMQEAGEIHG